MGFWPTGVLNLTATLGWAWDLCSPNLYQVKSPELEGWDSELWLGPWESSGRHKTSREEVSDCMGKVFPALGLRKVDGNLGWSGARGRGGAGEAARTLAPPTVGVVGNWGRGCLGSLFCSVLQMAGQLSP